MKALILTMIYIIEDWNLSLDEFKPIGKVLWWIPNFLNNVLTVLFKTIISPFVYLYFFLFEKYKIKILRTMVLFYESITEINKISQLK